MEQYLQQIAQRIKQSKRVLILTHTRPDGDAYGSALALAEALHFLNIDDQVCVDSDVPASLTFVEGIDKVEKQPHGEFDFCIAVDCSDEQRLGSLSDVFAMAKRKNIDTANVDHHISNTKFAKYNYVRCCAANCMNVATLIAYLGIPFDKKMAELLLVGLLTDSGNYSHDDVTEETLLLGAKLVKAGANVAYCNNMLFKRQPKARAALYAKTMTGIRYYHEGQFAVIVITQENMKACNADPTMTEGFVDFPLSVDGVEVAASLLEIKKGQYKISLRSKTYANVNQIAGVYGGGGHVRASGCMLFGDVEDVLDRLSYTVSQYLE